jgi:hypothetical protein
LLLRPLQSVGLNLARKADNAALIACAKKLLSYRQHPPLPEDCVTRGMRQPENAAVT